MREQQFFNDPAMDRLMGIVMSLAAEVYILRERGRELERILGRAGLISLEELESAEAGQDAAAERDAFVAAILEPLLAGGGSSRVDQATVSELLVGQGGIR